MKDLFGNETTKNIPIMPQSYKGKVGSGNKFTISKPREWTDDEIEWILNMRKQGFRNDEIAKSTGRTATSIQIKLKRIGKNENTYNAHHIHEKYACNASFYNMIHPNTILDLYCGVKSYWKTNSTASVTTNDVDCKINADYHEKAEKLIHRLYYEGMKYDIIDLDPYGSAYDCFDLAIKMAKKGLIITFGELGHKRWKRLDFVRRYYGIKTLEDFTLKKLIDNVEIIANRNKKTLVPVMEKLWDRIGRVYFEIKPIAITEQWE